MDIEQSLPGFVNPDVYPDSKSLPGLGNSGETSSVLQSQAEASLTADTLLAPDTPTERIAPSQPDPLLDESRDAVELLGEVLAEAKTCVRCSLAEARTNVVFGVGDPKADLMFIGEGPGADEDATGEPFVGRSGQLLTQLLKDEMSLTREQVYITNVVKCRPPGNRDPKPEEIQACDRFLVRQLQLIAPKVIVTLGNPATKTLLNTTTGITKLRGSKHEFKYPGGMATLIPTFHPSAALRNTANLPMLREDLVVARQELLSQS